MTQYEPRVIGIADFTACRFAFHSHRVLSYNKKMVPARAINTTTREHFQYKKIICMAPVNRRRDNNRYQVTLESKVLSLSHLARASTAGLLNPKEPVETIK